MTLLYDLTHSKQTSAHCLRYGSCRRLNRDNSRRSSDASYSHSRRVDWPCLHSSLYSHNVVDRGHSRQCVPTPSSSSYTSRSSTFLRLAWSVRHSYNGTPPSFCRILCNLQQGSWTSSLMTVLYPTKGSPLITSPFEIYESDWQNSSMIWGQVIFSKRKYLKSNVELQCPKCINF